MELPPARCIVTDTLTFVALLNVGDFPTTGIAGVRAELGDGTRELILVRDPAGVRAFLNSCPHLGLRLDWTAGAFLDHAGRFLQCAAHGALFRPADGHCVAGPCAGADLVPVAVTVADDVVVMADDGTVPACAVALD